MSDINEADLIKLMLFEAFESGQTMGPAADPGPIFEKWYAHRSRNLPPTLRSERTVLAWVTHGIEVCNEPKGSIAQDVTVGGRA